MPTARENLIRRIKVVCCAAASLTFIGLYTDYAHDDIWNIAGSRRQCSLVVRFMPLMLKRKAVFRPEPSWGARRSAGLRADLRTPRNPLLRSLPNLWLYYDTRGYRGTIDHECQGHLLADRQP
ncbi:hypothetical protein F5X96DRAFT_672499 [Biscogniauxia mediterranea]|nr:hypothetical protein F5X96DRAFT_672499 [Biscogniauxia mediterranea]